MSLKSLQCVCLLPKATWMLNVTNCPLVCHQSSPCLSTKCTLKTGYIIYSSWYASNCNWGKQAQLKQPCSFYSAFGTFPLKWHPIVNVARCKGHNCRTSMVNVVLPHQRSWRNAVLCYTDRRKGRGTRLAQIWWGRSGYQKPSENNNCTIPSLTHSFKIGASLSKPP